MTEFFKKMLPEDLQAQAVSLEKIEMKQFAWKWPIIFDVVDAVYNINTKKVLIVGGDVFYDRNGIVEFAYCGWAFKKNKNESLEVNVLRSKEETLKYLNIFKDRKPEEFIFAPFVAEQLEFYF